MYNKVFKLSKINESLLILFKNLIIGEYNHYN